MIRKNTIRENPGTVIYFAGAGIANAPIIIIAVILSFIDLERNFVKIILFTTIFVSSLVGGFMVAGKVSYRHETVGGMTGIFAFILNILLVFILFRSLTGDLQTFITFLVGGILGGFIIKKKREYQLISVKLK